MNARLVAAQTWAITRLSMRRARASRVFWGPAFLAAAPLALLALVVTVIAWQSGFAFAEPLPKTGDYPMASDTRDLVARFVVGGAYVRFSVIFSAIFFGITAVREEVDNQTLHYMLLQPTPRWTIMVGKYLGFVLATAPLMVAGVLLAHAIVLVPYGPRAALGELASGARWLEAIRQCLVVVGALAVWSAFFLLVGTVLKNLFFALVLYGWETALQFLPPSLKQFTLGHYIQSFLPVIPGESPDSISFVAETPSAWLSLVVLGTVMALSLGVSCIVMGYKECMYGGT